MIRTTRSPEPQWLDVHAIARRYSITPPTIWSWARERKDAFPRAVRLTAGTSRWRLADLEAWEADRQAQSGGSRREYDEARRREAQRALKAVSAENAAEGSKGSGEGANDGIGD